MPTIKYKPTTPSRRNMTVPSFEEITKYVIENAGEGDLVITLGCGDVNKCSAMILREL